MQQKRVRMRDPPRRKESLCLSSSGLRLPGPYVFINGVLKSLTAAVAGEWNRFHYFIYFLLMILPGFPTTVHPSGTSFMTTDPDTMMTLSPILTPSLTTAFVTINLDFLTIIFTTINDSC